ncbi:peptidoglycan-binding domain-containing protein [Shimia sp. SDUM112013]|uniref:peptidoglycan-binding domain-containing protein n=1 Tax=Shimia sp. SDUM112013 TaxID=3136160 RepID=UPI0032ED6450
MSLRSSVSGIVVASMVAGTQVPTMAAAGEVETLLGIGAGLILLDQANRNKNKPKKSTGTYKARSNADVAEAQRLLNQLGFSAGTADGLMGRKTRGAISEFRVRYGIPGENKVDQDLLTQLRLASRGELNRQDMATGQVGVMASNGAVIRGNAGGGATHGGFVTAVQPMQPAFTPTAQNGVAAQPEVAAQSNFQSAIRPLQPAFDPTEAQDDKAGDTRQVASQQGQFQSAIKPLTAVATPADPAKQDTGPAINPVMQSIQSVEGEGAESSGAETTEMASAGGLLDEVQKPKPQVVETAQTKSLPPVLKGTQDIVSIKLGDAVSASMAVLDRRAEDWVPVSVSGAGLGAPADMRLSPTRSEAAMLLESQGVVMGVGRLVEYDGVGMDRLFAALEDKYGLQQAMRDLGGATMELVWEGEAATKPACAVALEEPAAGTYTVAGVSGADATLKGFLLPEFANAAKAAQATCGEKLIVRATASDSGTTLFLWLMDVSAVAHATVEQEKARQPVKTKIEL